MPPNKQIISNGFYSFSYKILQKINDQEKEIDCFITVKDAYQTNESMLILKPIEENHKLENNQIFYIYFDETDQLYSIFSSHSMKSIGVQSRKEYQI